MKTIKNYTSSVPANKSILEIEEILIGMGARNIAKEYDGFGKVDTISFSIKQDEGVIPFKLPAKRGAILKFFLQQYKRPSAAQIKECEAQADRTAWRNIKTWVELQATMIKLEQVDFMEVFLPYAFLMQENKTFYQKVKEHQFKQLT